MRGMVPIHDLTPEEQEQMAQVEIEQQERQKKLYEKQMQEDQLKQERRQKAQKELADWAGERNLKIEGKR